MSLNNSSKTTETAIYKKAMEIFRLSRSISHYLMHDLGNLQVNGKENPHIYFTGDLVRQSVSLAPEILKAESKTFSEERYRHVASLTRLVNLLHENCDRLELSNSNGREFVQILRSELKKFRKLQRTWMLKM
ncbi:hypothetical protein RM545_08780 [Zunongwangia sp. F260]|uniref:Four helix bundle protein n=1 Tax=Autumnicola lenta TaxID=3075593 RepID=A0ABU3CKM3_9FLAO|nr:hypothetical protein [Zunongwangia sp. F260]MDT0646783.1 hypothetical protein [Zunongwangia sp. F260]